MLRGKHPFRQLDGNGEMTNVASCEQKISIDKQKFKINLMTNKNN
jgi:glutamate synthase domain-containing protein 1